MKRALLLPRLALALWFLVPTSCATTSGETAPSEPHPPPPKTVRTSELPGGGLRLSFEPVAHHPALEKLHVEEARTVEAAAERFGKAMGGTALRALMLVASLGLSKALPEVPEGGLRTLLNAPRYAMPGAGPSLEGATAVTMVADGTLIVAGVAAGTSASAVGSACVDGSEKKEGHHWHHLATNKNETSSVSGGPWTPRFAALFELAEMSLDAAENLVYLKGHKGPHPAAYHEAVYERLNEALGGCAPVSQCKRKLVEALRKLADQACTPGSRLHQLLTRPSD